MNIMDELSSHGNESDSFDLDRILEDGEGAEKRLLKPKSLMQELDKYVVGQEDAKRKLCVAVYNHYKRAELGNEDIKKSNILMVGPTGSGKTYIIETLAKVLDVPMVIVDANSYTEAGYVGSDVESMVERLLAKTDFDVEKAERGIIFIDEIDKLSSSGSDTERKVGGKGVQQALLKILEGCEVEAKPVSNDSRMGGLEATKKIKIRTHNILFVCGGAFPDMEGIIERRMTKSSRMGFGNTVVDKRAKIDDVLLHTKTDDLKEFGLIPELLGRLPVLVALEGLNENILVDILTKPKGNIFGQYKELMKYDAVDLQFSEEAFKWVATKALEKGTGARSLRSVMEELLEEAMFEVPSLEEVSAVIADIEDGECVVHYACERHRFVAAGGE